MAYKNYKIRDNWLDIDKYNDVDIQSVDGVIQTVKVNGVDVGGGGGSSDFSTAEVTIVSDSVSISFDNCPYIEDNTIMSIVFAVNFPAVFIVPLYKGSCLWDIGSRDYTTLSGNIQDTGDGLIITGNGTITISDGE